MDGSLNIGRRERKKRETTERIAIAARSLFARKGYEATTTQEVALEAGIPAGTLFGYINTKEDILIIALVHDALDELRRIGQRVEPGDGLLDQVITVYRGLLEYHARDVELSRHFIREIAVPRNMKLSPNAADLGNGVRDLICKVVTGFQAKGVLRTDISGEEVSWLLFAHYWNALRVWIHTPGSQEEFVEGLRRALSFQIEGLAAPRTQPAARIAPRKALALRQGRRRRKD